MKKIILLFTLLPFLGLSQIQISQDIDGQFAGYLCGSSVALSANGNIVAIGSTGISGNGEFPGQVRIFENQGGTWVQIGQNILGEASSDLTGSSVALSADGTIVAIGEPFNDNNGMSAGQVRIFEIQGGTWNQLGQRIVGEAAEDFSGSTVALSSDGTTVAVGAYNNDGNGNNSGHVRIYKNELGSWTQIGQDIDGEAMNDKSSDGIALSADGSIIAVGANSNDGNGSNSGHVRVYENQNNTWTQIGSDIDGEAAEDFSGTSISLSSDGTILAIGATRNNGFGEDSGHVRVFKNQGNTWTQVGQDINGITEVDQFGWRVSLSGLGTTVAISSIFSTLSAGRVSIYQNQGGSWVQVGQDIFGEAEGDFSGSSVALSSNADVLAIGAPQNDENGLSSGHVRIFDLTALLSTNEFSNSEFSLFPNPAKTEFSIQLDNNSILENINIYNTLGQLVLTSNNTTVNISNLNNGAYVVEISTNKGKASKTLIIE